MCRIYLSSNDSWWEDLPMRRRVTPKFWLIMIALTLVVFGASFAIMQNRYVQETQKLAQVTDYRNALTSEVAALSEELEYVQTDEYIVRAARDELGMIMPGEVRYVNGAN